jgi:hypothetical protein
MVLSKRERIIFWTTLSILLILVIDRIVITPALAQLDDISKNKADLELQVFEMSELLKQRKTMSERWDKMLETGLTDSPSAAESYVFHALEEWSSQCRIDLTAITPQRATAVEGLQEVSFTIAGKGSLETVGEFLWLVEQAEMPVKIASLILGSTNASGQEMTLTLKISVLCRVEEEPDANAA